MCLLGGPRTTLAMQLVARHPYLTGGRSLATTTLALCSLAIATLVLYFLSPTLVCLPVSPPLLECEGLVRLHRNGEPLSRSPKITQSKVDRSETGHFQNRTPRVPKPNTGFIECFCRLGPRLFNFLRLCSLILQISGSYLLQVRPLGKAPCA